MDKTDGSKPRRPLPIPNASTSSNVAPVDPTNFYGAQPALKPPPLPTRPKSPRAAGSNHTGYHAPTTPSYFSSETTPFREPELIADEPVSNDSPPELIAPTEADYKPSPWYRDDHNYASNWGPTDSNWGTETSAFDAVEYMTSSFAPKGPPIDGRDEDEEINWWDASVRAKHSRPGSGLLAPLLTDSLHNPDHSLLSVSVTPPDLKPRESVTAPNSRQPTADAHHILPQSHTSPSRPLSSPPPITPRQLSPPPPVPAPPPTADDVRTAIPHPNAYYCRKHNGWALILWKSSSVVPPLAKSFQNKEHQPLPDQNWRKRTNSCIGEGEQPFGQANLTHHFHTYEKAVDAHKLNPPFCRSQWEKVGRVKEKRRQATISMEDFDMVKLQAAAAVVDKMEEDEEEEEGDLLDLYVCCQCSFYCVASSTIIPGVVPPKYVEEFVREKKEHPLPGKTGEASVLSGWETILTIIENNLWKGENRGLAIYGGAFQRKLGWNPVVESILQRLGFTTRQSDPTNRESTTLHSGPTDVLTPRGRQNRAMLLRAWVEINVWLSEYIKSNAKVLKDILTHKLWVNVNNAREMYQTAIGSHPDQIARGELSTSLVSYQPLNKAWDALGMTPTSYSANLLAFSYLAQCRCDPINTMEYFTHFWTIFKAMQDVGELPPQDLQHLVMVERERLRFTYQDLVDATRVLGFGSDGPLGVEFEDDVPEEFIINAWREALKRAWRDTEHGSDLQRTATEAFRVIADARGSVRLRKMWEDGKGKTMTPDRAYDILEIPKLVDDAMLLTVFQLRLQEQPSQIEKWKDALSIIAEVRDSARLRHFLETGQDPGDIVAPTPPELPRGLNQLGNTCYLNSLLQYFYTIRELREAVAPMANVDMKSAEDDKLTDDDLKRHRVGGRLVTRREIARAKKFMSQLADLFWQLEYCETAAVTPTIELAKLALVTSRDEEEDEVDKGGTDSSNDTDATLVDDGPSRFSVSESSPAPVSPNSVLGKRVRDPERQQSEMLVDSPTESKEGFVIVSKPTSPSRSTSPPPLERAGSPASKAPANASTATDIDGDVVMDDGSRIELSQNHPPTLPPRKPEVSDSVMMFGKQHDVSECMDNCMFQIETALLKFEEMSGSQDDKTSVVKRLFYGKMRQRVAVTAEDRRSRYSIHEKEDLFSHLPVNVAEDGVDLYDGLSRYFDDVVEFEGKKARMEVSLVELPPLLQIQLQRVQFNRETLQPYKSQAYVKFGETIYMDRFLDSADPQKKAQSKALQAELSVCRDRLQLLTREKHAPFITALSNTHEFLFQEEGILLPEVDDELVSQLNGEQEYVKAEIDDLRARASTLKEELELLWRDNSDAAYELTSVFIHRGSSPSWGHYFFYSRHLPGQPDSWFKYNDSDVSVVSKDEVMADTSGSTANPYLLVFARKGSEVVDTVKRFDPMSLEDAET